MDVLAPYLLERLNNDLYYISSYVYLFVRRFLSVRRKIRQMQPRERIRQIL